MVEMMIFCAFGAVLIVTAFAAATVYAFRNRGRNGHGFWYWFNEW